MSNDNEMKRLVFMSFIGIHSKKLLGACVVEVSDPEEANEECKKLGLMPEECNQAKGYVLKEPEENMEIGRFYSAEEMKAIGY